VTRGQLPQKAGSLGLNGGVDVVELRIICQGSLYTHCCRASLLLQLGFLVVTG